MTHTNDSSLDRSIPSNDPLLQPFSESSFEPISFLNSSLPTWSRNSRAASDNDSLANVSTQLQSLISNLNAQLTRQSNQLNQLTDEIIRKGSRLEYEVDLLRGDTIALDDMLTGELKEEILTFAPDAYETEGKVEHDTNKKQEDEAGSKDTDVSASPRQTDLAQGQAMPEYITRLRTLTTVRERLDEVVQTFGAAIDWPIPPSEMSNKASFVSVSAPAEPNNKGGKSLEEAGREHAEKLRTEIMELVGDGEDPQGIAMANKRIEQLRELCEVWKGTAEEKPRLKFVDSLTKLVQDRDLTTKRGATVSSRSYRV